jgi:arginyl-tRNA synthetase
MKLHDLKKMLDLPEWAHAAYSSFSDLSFSCFEIAKKQGKNVKEFAEQTANNIHSKYIKKASALNGYVNIDLDFSELEKDHGLLSRVEIAGMDNRFSNKVIRLEHTSVNPNKGLHIGHMRNSYIGEFIRKSLIYSRANVTTSNFIEDTGAQVADIIVGFKYLGKEIETEEKFDLYCSKIYKEINEDYAKDNSLLEKRKQVLLDIENNDEQTMELLRKLVGKVLISQLSTLTGERIKYDLLDLERYILGEGIVKAAMDKLKQEGIAAISESEKNNGCLVSVIDGNEVTLSRSDGTSLYIAKDIAYAMIKHNILSERIKYKKFSQNFDGSDILISDPEGGDYTLPRIDSSFTLTDSAQNAEQYAVKSIIERFSGKDSYNHYGYEPVAISKETASYLGIKTEDKFMRMSGRKGITVEFDSLLQVIKNRIIEESAKNGKKMGDNDALKLASSVIRYYILKFSPSKMVVFDINDATSLKGDSAVYINYSYSRAKSVLDKAASPDYTGIEFDDAENSIIRELLFWEEILDDAVVNLKSSVICDYLHKIADTFNSFYEKNRIIGDQKENSRLLITKAFKDITEKLSDFVGMELLEKI